MRTLANEIAAGHGRADLVQARIKLQGLTSLKDIEAGQLADWAAWLRATLEELQAKAADSSGAAS